MNANATQPKEFQTRLDAALFYVSRGWRVMPLHSPDKSGKCSCGRDDCPSPAKHPRTGHGLKDATINEKQIRQWWKQWPNANVAIATGPESGLLVLDIDGDRGEASLAALIKQYGRPPETIKALTGGGGRHIFFVYPSTYVIRNSAGKLGNGLDTRGEGGYVVAAPSVHISGQRYKWLNDPDPAPTPEWLLSLCAAPKPQATTSPPIADAIIEGGRNDALTSLAGSMRRRGMSEETIFLALMSENNAKCRPPLDESEVRQIAAHVGRYNPDPVEIPIEQQIHSLPEHLNFEIHQNAWRNLIHAVARKGVAQQEQYVKVIAARFKFSLGTVRKEIKAAEAEIKLAPAIPSPLAEPRAINWGLAQDMRDNILHYGVWLPTEKGEWLFQLVKSGRRVETGPDVPADRLPKDRARWSVDKKTPFNVFAFVDGETNDSPHALFIDLRTFLKRFMWYPDDPVYDLLAIWVLQTYVFMVFDQVGYLALVGSKRSGKTRLFELLEMLCFNAVLSTSVSDSYVFRSVEVDRITLLVDEADQLKAQAKDGVNERLEILRSGYRRSGSVGRIEGEDRRRMDFSTYSMKAIANVSGIEDALEDRTLSIPVERKPGHILIEKMVHRHIGPEAQILRNRLYCFGLTYAAELAKIYDTLEVQGVNDREAEIWAGILTIARVAAEDRIGGLMDLARANSTRKELHEGAESTDAQEIMAIHQLITDEHPGIVGTHWFQASRLQKAIRDQLGWDSFTYRRLSIDLVKLRIVEDSANFKQRFRLMEEVYEEDGKTLKAKIRSVMCYKLERHRVEEAAQRFNVSLLTGENESADSDENPY